jgi:translin
MSDDRDLAADLERVAEGLRGHFAAKHRAREQALALARETIRHSANAIRAVHRGDAEGAQALFHEAGERLRAARTALAEHPDIYYAGFVHDAAKEYTEAAVTIALVLGGPLPEPGALGVEAAAYLNGLGETVGELRRSLLDRLRRGEIARCEQLLQAMDDLYSLLVTIDYPDAMTGGLRRTTDVARGILEKTRGDLTVAARQHDLERRLDALRPVLAPDQASAPAP